MLEVGDSRLNMQRKSSHYTHHRSVIFGRRPHLLSNLSYSNCLSFLLSCLPYRAPDALSFLCGWITTFIVVIFSFPTTAASPIHLLPSCFFAPPFLPRLTICAALSIRALFSSRASSSISSSSAAAVLWQTLTSAWLDVFARLKSFQFITCFWPKFCGLSNIRSDRFHLIWLSFCFLFKNFFLYAFLDYFFFFDSIVAIWISWIGCRFSTAYPLFIYLSPYLLSLFNLILLVCSSDHYLFPQVRFTLVCTIILFLFADWTKNDVDFFFF